MDGRQGSSCTLQRKQETGLGGSSSLQLAMLTQLPLCEARGSPAEKQNPLFPLHTCPFFHVSCSVKITHILCPRHMSQTRYICPSAQGSSLVMSYGHFAGTRPLPSHCHRSQREKKTSRFSSSLFLQFRCPGHSDKVKGC